MGETILGEKSGEEAPKAGAGEGLKQDAPTYDLSQTPEWVKSLQIDDAIKADPSLRPIADINNLAKSYVNAQKMIGADKIVVPGKHASDEDWKNVFRKLGQPDTLDKYDLGVKVEGDGFDAKFFNGFREQAHKLGVLPKQAKELYEWHESMMGNEIEQRQAEYEAKQSDGIKSLQKEWGDAFEGKIQLAKAAIGHLGGDKLFAYMNETGLGNDPVMVQVFAKIGEMFKEDGIVGEGNRGIGQTRSEVEASVNSILGNKNHPYFDGTHPGHKAAVDEMTRLMSKLH